MTELITMTAIEWTRRLFGHATVTEGVPVRPRPLMLRERLCPLGDDFPVEDEDGELAFSVDGRALRVGGTLVLRDRYGIALYRIPQHAMYQKTSMEIERAGGGTAATVRRAKVGTMRDRWTVTIPGGEPLRLRGAVADHEYRIERGGRQLAEVSKRWFRQPGVYGVAIAPGEDEGLLVTIAAATDRMSR